MFDVNLLTFLGLRQDFGGSWTSGNNSNEITAREIIDRLMGGGGGMSTSWQKVGFEGVIKHNLRKNGGMMVGAVVGIPIAFNIGKKLLRKPILTPANRMLKAAGITGVKV